MLYNIYGKEINEVFHKESIHLINKIGNEEKKAINDCLQKKIESVLSEPVGKQILTSSFIPGEDWTNTVFQPIYSVAADCNQELAAKIFGLILMQNFIENQNEWVFMKVEDEKIKGSYYFKKEY